MRLLPREPRTVLAVARFDSSPASVPDIALSYWQPLSLNWVRV